MNFLKRVSNARNLCMSFMAQGLTTSVMHHLGALTVQNEV